MHRRVVTSLSAKGMYASTGCKLLRAAPLAAVSSREAYRRQTFASASRALRPSSPFRVQRSADAMTDSSHTAARQMRCAASSGEMSTRSSEAYNKLQTTKVWLVSEQKEVDITSLWGDSDRAFLVFARSMGCNFCQQLARELTQDVLPKLQQEGVKLFLVSMGPPERGLEFAELTGFPPEQLLADPDNVSYDRLQLKNSGAFWTFFDPRTPLTLVKRAGNDGLKSTFNALANWRPWIPTKKGQAHQQGGAFLFQGKELVWQQYDEATGAHTEPDEILKVAFT